MAIYNNGYPATYQNPYMQNFQLVPPYQQPQPQQQNGFVRVQNENEARMYPVAPGGSVIFIDENSPFCYTKTVDVSQLDRPKFSKYKLVKQEESETSTQPQVDSRVEYATIDFVNKELEKLRMEFSNIKDHKE